MKESWRKEPQNLRERECLEYLREHPVFDRLLRGFREKYASYGCFSGTVVLSGLTEEERESLEGFFQKSYHGKKSTSISAERFERALRESRFSEITPKELLEVYFRQEMMGKKEQKREEERRWQQALDEAKEGCAGTRAEAWIGELEQMEGKSYLYLMKRYREAEKSPDEVRRLLALGIRIILSFPYLRKETEYLAVFAAGMTGNPHAFDDGAKDGKFLQILVAREIGHLGLEIPGSSVFPAMQRQRLYYSVGILRDDISNYVMLSGIRAWKENGEIHAGMEGFRKDGDPVHVPLSVIAGWSRVDCPEKEIYIVENPSVFAMLCGKWKGRKACMCMNGQPRLSAVLMLDLLEKAEVKVYYAGDFDPEGLLIGQKVKQYYGGETVYWHMSVQEYEESRSREKISEKRMKILRHIREPELVRLAEAIEKSKVAGYQENVCEFFEGMGEKAERNKRS